MMLGIVSMLIIKVAGNLRRGGDCDEGEKTQLKRVLENSNRTRVKDPNFSKPFFSW
jgi:hypothetical protein